LLTAANVREPLLGPFVYGSDGRGGPNLIVPAGGSRRPRTQCSAIEFEDEGGNVRSADNLFMNGPEIFNFTLSAVPESIDRLLAKSGVTLGDVDLFVFHQCNQQLLDHLCKRLRLPLEKFYVFMKDCGNTVSSTIPIALKSARSEGRFPDGSLAMLVGFGVGYSWGATLLRSTGIP
jgi:3-oxoacyl-[acyl-carrier-protein] synthase-3